MNGDDKLSRLFDTQMKVLAHSFTNPKACRGPVITISREPGCDYEAIADLLASKLGLVIYDRRIAQRIAHATRASNSEVSSFDERVRTEFEIWISDLMQGGPVLTTHAYRTSLKKVLASIAARGCAIIVGRGGAMAIPPDKQIALRLVAPLEARLKVVMKRLRLSERQARNHIVRVEREQRQFVKKHFQADPGNPLHYHLVINTALVGPEAVLEIVKAMIAARS